MSQRFQWHRTPKRSRSLVNGLHFAWRGHDDAWPPIAAAVHDGTSYKTLGPAGWDVGYLMSDATPARLYFPYHQLSRPSTAITVATVMTPINSTDVQAMVVCLANDNYRLSWGMQDAGNFYSGRDIRFWVCASVASQVATAIDGSQSLTIGTPYLLVGTWGAATGNYVELSIWNLKTGALHGTGISSSTQAGPISTDATGDPLKLQIGGDAWNATLVSGDNWIGMGAVWNRVLSDAELAVLVEDPYGWLQPTRRIPVMVPEEEEAQAVTGSAALALAQPSIAASGTVTQVVTGTASLVLAQPTIAAVGSVGASALVSGTLEAGAVESDVVAGGKTIIIDLTGTTWIPS